jgi:hypothetical protein
MLALGTVATSSRHAYISLLHQSRSMGSTWVSAEESFDAHAFSSPDLFVRFKCALLIQVGL